MNQYENDITVRFVKDRHGKPMLVVKDFPGLMADFSISGLRSLAAALNAAADEAESAPAQLEKTYQFTMNHRP